VVGRQLRKAQHVPPAAHRVDLAAENLAVVGEEQEAELHRPTPAPSTAGQNQAPQRRRPWGFALSRSASLRRHPQGAVEADGLAVEHRVLDDRGGELGVLRGLSEARRERDAGAKRLA
jgi:hypothetical protein